MMAFIQKTPGLLMSLDVIPNYKTKYKIPLVISFHVYEISNQDLHHTCTHC